MGRGGAGGDPFVSLRRTHHGENRIKHCVKYDLEDHFRLVTVQTASFCILVYCGSHEDCDRWLDRNRGFVPVVGLSGAVSATWESMPDAGVDSINVPAARALGPLYARLPEGVFDRLVVGIGRSTVRAIESFEAHLTDADLWECLARVEDADRRIVLGDVFRLLRGGQIAEAAARAALHFGESRPLANLTAAELPATVDSETIRRIDPTSPSYREALRRFMQTARYLDWMMFMHPEQETVVSEDFPGSAKLIGVSGSGKTCVVVKRAVRLAGQYPGERILVVTLNPALAHLIDALVAEVAGPDTARQIRVTSFYSLCRELALRFDPSGDRHFRLETWKHDEHVDAIWIEYYRGENNNHDAAVLHPVHDSLLARGWNPEPYLREEIDWLRSALPPERENEYLQIVRKGRTVPLTTPFRELVVAGTKGWQEKMDAVGVRDTLGLVQAVMPHLAEIRPEYRCAIVDEVQDLGNVELAVIRALIAPAANDLFFAGDAAQAVTSKYQSFREVGIKIPPAASRRLTLNYRNSREILTLAWSMVARHLTEEMQDREDLPLLDPQYSQFSATTPVLLSGDSLAHELGNAYHYARQYVAQRGGAAKACIAVCGRSFYELSQYGAAHSLPVLDGAVAIEEGQVFLSDLEQTKGFEFDLMCIVNCSAAAIPPVAAPDSECFRDLARLYVAITRAKADLVVSYAGQKSKFVVGMAEHLLEMSWSEFIDVKGVAPLPIPAALAELRDVSIDDDWRPLTGPEFLLTRHALGVSVDLSRQIRELVDGRGVRRGGDSVKWARMGQAADEFLRVSSARRPWGRDGGRQFSELLARIS